MVVMACSSSSSSGQIPADRVSMMVRARFGWEAVVSARLLQTGCVGAGRLRWRGSLSSGGPTQGTQEVSMRRRQGPRRRQRRRQSLQPPVAALPKTSFSSLSSYNLTFFLVTGGCNPRPSLPPRAPLALPSCPSLATPLTHPSCSTEGSGRMARPLGG